MPYLIIQEQAEHHLRLRYLIKLSLLACLLVSVKPTILVIQSVHTGMLLGSSADTADTTRILRENQRELAVQISSRLAPLREVGFQK